MSKAVITIPSNMSEETYSYITDSVKGKFGTDTDIVKVINPELIGGFTLSVDGNIYDLSVNTQLEQIEKSLKK